MSTKKDKLIKQLKRVAKDSYIAYHDILDKYDCGETLALEISSELREAKRICNEALTKLHELGEPLYQI